LRYMMVTENYCQLNLTESIASIPILIFDRYIYLQ